jgi:hypothetical protein
VRKAKHCTQRVIWLQKIHRIQLKLEKCLKVNNNKLYFRTFYSGKRGRPSESGIFIFYKGLADKNLQFPSSTRVEEDWCIPVVIVKIVAEIHSTVVLLMSSSCSSQVYLLFLSSSQPAYLILSNFNVVEFLNKNQYICSGKPRTS